MLYAIAEDVSARKARGAFYTPMPIARYLAEWAIAGRPRARVLDPSCGEGVFLQAAGDVLRGLAAPPSDIRAQLCGVDIHEAALDEIRRAFATEAFLPWLLSADFMSLSPPGELFGELGTFDAIIGNPPYVRYQLHTGAARRASAEAALRQGVRLSGLASSWAALLVHAASFLTPDGRLAMVLPAELLSVGYAAPVRRWLRQRFASVRLVLFERLQFEDALENVVLLMAEGHGGCGDFALVQATDADDLAHDLPGGSRASHEARWTHFLLSGPQHQLFTQVVANGFVPLSDYGSPELGTVTGANPYFTFGEQTRREYGLSEDEVAPISPPGTRHLKGALFTEKDWGRLRDEGERVWLLWPRADEPGAPLRRYLELGERLGVPAAYKCRVRSPWWRPPLVSPPDMFFTYMSHRFPRLIANGARVSFVNSMHGVRLREGVPSVSHAALPLLALNSVTMLGAELRGRSYGGGVLKMEPSEARSLPVPNFAATESAWKVLEEDSPTLEAALRQGSWQEVVARIDQVLIGDVLHVNPRDARTIRETACHLRGRRLGRARAVAGD